MKKIDKSIKFHSVNICVLTVSDTRNENNDKSSLVYNREGKKMSSC